MTTAAGRVSRFSTPIAHRGATTLLLTGALVLTGCGDDEPVPKFASEPTPTPTATSTATATPKPTATPTVVQDESAEEDPAEEAESAEEFIRRWNDEQREMQKGDTTEYRRIAGKCEACVAAADRIDEIYAADGFVETAGRTVQAIKRSDRSPGVKHAYLVEVASAPTTYQDSADALPKTLQGGPATYEVRLARRKGEWVLVDTAAVPS